MQCRMLVSGDMWADVCKSLLPILLVLQVSGISYFSQNKYFDGIVPSFIDQMNHYSISAHGAVSQYSIS